MTRHLRKSRIGSAVAAVTLGVLTAGSPSPPAAAEEQEVSFTLDVFPILESRCVSCHSPGGQGYEASGLDLTGYEGLMAGTKHGPIVVKGDPLTSNLNVLIEGRASPELRMPHGERPLLKEQQKIIRDWVRQGAKDN